MKDSSVEVEQYIPLVDWLARKHFGGRREFDDVRAAGLEALCRAAQSFDPDRDVKFGTYARHRVHGAMIDVLRLEYGRHERRREFLAGVTSLDGLRETLETFDVAAPEQNDEVGPFMQLVAGLPAEDRFILVAHDFYEVTEAEIADELGVTESRVSQIRKAALVRLRAKVERLQRQEQRRAA